MNIGNMARHKISFKKQFEIVYWIQMATAIEKLRKLVAAHKVQLSLCPKSS